MMEKERCAPSADWSFDKVPSNFGDKNFEFTDELNDMGAIKKFLGTN